jgi:hypothetical protein
MSWVFLYLWIQSTTQSRMASQREQFFALSIPTMLYTHKMGMGLPVIQMGSL